MHGVISLLDVTSYDKCMFEMVKRNVSFEYLQHMFWLRNKKICLITHSYLECYMLLRICCLLVLTNDPRIMRERSGSVVEYLTRD